MTTPQEPSQADPLGASFSTEDATEAALTQAFSGAVKTWLGASAAGVLGNALVPNLSMMAAPSGFITDAVRRVKDALHDVWVRAYARTGLDLRAFIDSYTMTLPYRLDGLSTLANRRASRALEEKMSGGTEAMRAAVRQALSPDEYEGYVNRLAQTEASISVNAARHDMAMALYRNGAQIEKVWTTRDDERVRLTHFDAEGQSVPFTAPFWVGGVPMQHPGDPTAPASEVANCRCQARYVVISRGRQ